MTLKTIKEYEFIEEPDNKGNANIITCISKKEVLEVIDEMITKDCKDDIWTSARIQLRELKERINGK